MPAAPPMIARPAQLRRRATSPVTGEQARRFAGAAPCHQYGGRKPLPRGRHANGERLRLRTRVSVTRWWPARSVVTSPAEPQRWPRFSCAIPPTPARDALQSVTRQQRSGLKGVVSFAVDALGLLPVHEDDTHTLFVPTDPPPCEPPPACVRPSDQCERDVPAPPDLTTPSRCRRSDENRRREPGRFGWSFARLVDAPPLEAQVIMKPRPS